VAVSTRRGVSRDEEQETDRLGKRDCPDLYRARSSGGGAMPNPNVITRIGRSDWPRPLTWPASLGRKPPHFVSGKAIPDSEHISLRPHDMTRIAHTKIGTRIVLQKTPGPCPGDRSRIPHARLGVRPAFINVLASRAPTWHALYIPRLDRSFTGRREEKTFTIHGESAAASEGRRYITMDKSMHVSQAAYVSAFEHIPYSAHGSAITHVASARVHTTPLACARGEHQYVSDIEVEKEKAASTRTLVSHPTWRGVGFIGLRTSFVQRGRRAGRVSRAVKNTIRAAS